MVDRKASQPKVQKTLLSFFKPKTDSTESNSVTSTTTNASTTTPISTKTLDPAALSPSKKRNQSSISLENDILQTFPQKKRRARENSVESNDNQNDEPLFPPGFTNDLKRLALSKSSSNEIDSVTQSKPQTSKKGAGLLSRFEYTSKGTDQSDTSQMDIDYDQVKDERREKFLKKFGNNVPDDSEGNSATQKSRPRRKLIVSESDEEYAPETQAIDQPPQQKVQQATKPSKPSGGSASSQKSPKSILTPLEKQYVEIKDKYPDSILCIEVGYKFRFFGEDAEIASKELCIAHFLDHNFYTASIPIHRLNVHVRRLVSAGYKVGVVRQMETAALKSAGDNKSAPFTRKLTNLYTKATFLESLDQDDSFVGNELSSSQYLMCIYEQPQGGTGADEKVKIAVLAVQPATGDIIYDEFTDGHFRNELETRLLHIQPAELIVPAEPMSKATEKLIGHLTGSTHRRAGSAGKSHDDVRIERTDGFVKYSKALSLVTNFYSDSLKEEQQKLGNMDKVEGSNKKSQMEALLNTALSLSQNLIIALSAMITHLTDFGLAPVFRLSKYFECFTSRSHMLLNGNTISNLEIYRNQTNWTTRGSLFAILDHTQTGFGRRLLKKWVGKPLVNRSALQERVDAVEEILRSGGNRYLESVKKTLKGLIDLEKGVCRIHYGKSSPKEFLSILKTFKVVADAIQIDSSSEPDEDFGLESPMLKRLINSLTKPLQDTLYFLNSLNEFAAKKDDKLLMFQDDIIEEKWPEISNHRENIITTEGELSTHLESIRKILREPRLEFTSVSGIDYLVEVKNKDVAKVPKAWIKISGTKQASRFHTQETIQLIQAKAQHQERLVIACDRAFTEFQQEFSERYEVFRDLVQNLAILDCLFSLATVACLPGYVKPEYVDDDLSNPQANEQTDEDAIMEDVRVGSMFGKQTSKITIDIKNGRHPMVEQMLPSGNFVPNHVQFGTNPDTGVDEKTIILTGPNMGGKSCYIRQVALLCIMAQIGSYLPADSARISLLDAVFTRMGASDNIFGHESTFMVELQETSDILKMASPRSLVILDELGRGTSTLDGVAIAFAVLKYVVSQIGSITLFVTHYPSLAEVATEFPEGTIKNFHMGFMATAAGSVAQSSSNMELETESPDGEEEMALDDMDIVFLYQLVPGVSLKSYGLNVARLAKLPVSLIKKARVKSKELEKVLENRIEQRQHKQKLLSQLQAILQCSTADQANDITIALNKFIS